MANLCCEPRLIGLPPLTDAARRWYYPLIKLPQAAMLVASVGMTREDVIDALLQGEIVGFRAPDTGVIYVHQPGLTAYREARRCAS